MQEDVISILQEKLSFGDKSIDKIIIFHKELLKANSKYNLISSSTVNNAWNRHILDSAQLVRFINFENEKTLCDLGSGAGFPGIIISIFNNNPKFHVKLYEKSPVKCKFLNKIKDILELKCTIVGGNCKDDLEHADYVVARAFKKFEQILDISREIIKNNHKLIVLKGKSAQAEVNKALIKHKFSYTLEPSMTERDSKIVIVNYIKNCE